MTNDKQQTEINAVEYLAKVNQFAKENNTGKPRQQTAIEWLVQQFKEYDFADVKDTENYIIKMQSFVLTEKLDKAKEMEKQMMIEFAEQVFRNRYNEVYQSLTKVATDTFNETYGGGEK
jgi:hypothetical protein